jgi:hypothetical protein
MNEPRDSWRELLGSELAKGHVAPIHTELWLRRRKRIFLRLAIIAFSSAAVGIYFAWLYWR